MYSGIVAALRVVLGYLLLAPFIFGATVTTLLATNVLVSYWFQHRRERKLKTRPGNSPGALPLEPPVQRIPRLGFASLVIGKEAGFSSLFPTEFNSDKWEYPRISLGEGYEQLEHELGQVLGLVVRDFVQEWFRELSADTSFPRCVFAQMAQAIEGVAERVRGKIDTAELFVGQILPLVTAHIRAIREALPPSGAEDSPSGVVTAEDRLRVEQAYKLHPALRSLRSSDDDGNDEAGAKREEKKLVLGHIRRVVDLVLPLILGPEQSTFAPHRVLVRELLNGALLAPLVLSVAEPDTINQVLDGQLERLIREQHMVNELRDALDQQAREPVDDEEALYNEGDLVSDPSNVRTYEQFMTTIDECNDGVELGRIREDILAQIRKRRILIMGQSKDDIVHGQRVGDTIVYINRLYVAKKKAERRLESLQRGESGGSGGVGRRRGNSASSVISPFSSLASVDRRSGVSRASTYYEHRDDPAKLGPPQFTLHEILTNVSSLSAFAEFMDLIGHRFILEFWVNVEGVRQASMDVAVLPSVVGSLWKTYFTLRVDELAGLGSEVEAAVSRVQRCLKGHRHRASVELDTEHMGPEVCVEAFDLICLVQAAVFRHMEQAEFPPFLRSALYTRFLKEYYVTPRQDHLEASLFARNGQERRLSVARSATAEGSVGRRSVSGESSCSAPAVATSSSSSPSPARPKRQSRVWTFAGMRGRPGAPLVSTDRSEAAPLIMAAPLTMAAPLAMAVPEEPTPETMAVPEEPISETMAATKGPTPETVAASEITAVPEEPFPEEPAPAAMAAPARRSVRVGRSEVRRLSASLRTIGLGEAADDGDDDDDDDQQQQQRQLAPIDAGGSGSESEATSDTESDVESDEAEALVIGRAVAPPAPGDLFVGERAALVARAAARTAHQMAIVRALMRQAAARRRPHEQRVLRASYGGLRREALALAQQQRAYAAAAATADHALSPQRTRVHIPRAVGGGLGGSGGLGSGSGGLGSGSGGLGSGSSGDDDGAPHVVYLIEVQQRAAGARLAPVGWVVARRFREFFALHRELRAALPPDAMRRHALPARTQGLLPRPLLRARDVEPRRRGLEAYLQGLLADARACGAPALRRFLSSAEPPADGADGSGGGGGWMQRICQTVGEDISGVTGAESMLEIIVQELGAQVAMQQQEHQQHQHQHQQHQPGPEAAAAAAFVDPLSDAFVEVFGLKTRRNWLRRQAISILLRHIVGGAVERRVRDAVAGAVAAPLAAGALASLRGSLWPAPCGGVALKFQGFAPRSPEQAAETAKRARAQVLWYVPRVLAAMVGRKNARDGASLLIGAVQTRRPNLSLVLALLDAVVAAVFPEIKYQLEHIA
ncbi:tRNA (guanine-N(7)-)-methyltransferase (tRNA(m7G46)-methyltransferase) [Coemansia sp. BCRC 34962]|nr:tRNA (guanine-N(7)-)-methyltransferase (tRNA(m7G46)-methyltransferase) [Coemansia sp. BCRC 34962]